VLAVLACIVARTNVRNRYHPDTYDSKNVWEDAAAFSNHFWKVDGWMDAFCGLAGESFVHDDPRINTTSVICTMQAWNVCLQKYADAYDESTLLTVFLEGAKFMIPSVAEDSTFLPGTNIPTSQREAGLI
jgi:hypothetical protein